MGNILLHFWYRSKR